MNTTLLEYIHSWNLKTVMGDILLDNYNLIAERAYNYRKTGLAAAVDVAHKAS
jgi:hypothetical protein